MKYKEGVVLEANSHLNSLNKKNSGQACITMSADWPLFSSLKQYSNCQTFYHFLNAAKNYNHDGACYGSEIG